MNRLSKLYLPYFYNNKGNQPFKPDITSKSYRLMWELGLIKPTGQGTFFHVMPMLQKSVDKCIKLIDHYMETVDAQKMIIPMLMPQSLLKTSGRIESFGKELYRLKDRNGDRFALSPTFEESITELVANSGSLSHSQYPLRLYQIGSKFRDENAAKHGLLRGKEFIMKDLYTFDLSREASLKTYEQVNQAYVKLFDTIGVPYVKVKADSGAMGGSVSHEYHYICDCGEDVLSKCSKCDSALNDELVSEACPTCNNPDLEKVKAIEIGHTFQLDDKYTKPLNAQYMSEIGKPGTLEMACFGIGVTRLIAASVEYLSKTDELRWPFHLAPYSICIIQPKDGSKEQPHVQNYVDIIYNHLKQIPALENSIIVDDRNHFTIGHRMVQAKRYGYPIIVVVGRKAIDPSNPLFEVHYAENDTNAVLPMPELIKDINDYANKKSQLL